MKTYLVIKENNISNLRKISGVYSSYEKAKLEITNNKLFCANGTKKFIIRKKINKQQEIA
jgi:hypothetical protein